jgi:prepilin-type N-terminal cleavage/methylation domain-containing protein
MKALILKSNQEDGFTLIELMIVVGIIGILVAIAAPNFERYQSKARQSEAKIAMGAIFGAEKSFYSEYAAYISAVDAIGYSPEGNKRFYNVGWLTTHSTVPVGWGGFNSAANFPIQNATGFVCTATTLLTGNLTTDAQAFTVSASGCIRNTAPQSDIWNITDQKILSNNQTNL